MAGELKHADVGTNLTKTEWEATTSHVVDSAAEGDVLYVNSAGTIVRLAAGSDGQVLTLASGVPSWAASSAAYTTTFDNADLSLGALTVTHSLGSRPVVVQVYNNSWQLIYPDEVTLTDTNTATISLASYGTITGTWSVVVSG